MNGISGPSTPDSIFKALNTAHNSIDKAVLKLEKAAKAQGLSVKEYEAYMSNILKIARCSFNQIDELHRKGSTGEQILAVADLFLDQSEKS
jgi:hypothetical protein